MSERPNKILYHETGCGTDTEQVMVLMSQTSGALLHEASHLEVDFGFSSSHTQAEGWCINSTVTFPKDEELILSEVWELGKETLQGSVIIISNLRGEHVSCKDCLFLRFLLFFKGSQPELTRSSSVA